MSPRGPVTIQYRVNDSLSWANPSSLTGGIGQFQLQRQRRFQRVFQAAGEFIRDAHQCSGDVIRRRQGESSSGASGERHAHHNAFEFREYDQWVRIGHHPDAGWPRHHFGQYGFWSECDGAKHVARASKAIIWFQARLLPPASTGVSLPILLPARCPLHSTESASRSTISRRTFTFFAAPSRLPNCPVRMTRSTFWLPSIRTWARLR